MNTITSKDNNLVKFVRKLRDKKHRKKEKKFIVEGFRFVEEALKSDYCIEYILINEKSLNKVQEFNINIEVIENKVYILNESSFNSISGTENSQGILAIVNMKEVLKLKEDGLYILADRVQDPGNMGTIIRTAHAANASGILITEGTVDVYNEKTLRSSMGSIFYIPVIEDFKLDKIKDLKLKGFKVLASSLDTNKSLYDLDLCKKNLILAVGNEGSGVSEEVYNISDETFIIPMPGNAESLNAGVATSIIIFEIVRQNLK
ncbi:TrmH family RNA methyltransferase [Clostridium tetani]|uniref:23S rRNA methyltransferase n=1 Tax=Clostridium tetani (strain Massachusetts / E88) TaxID=212717 RepID=Q891T6_CLOTE|nr:RNA methyltransferase [Clostridium tetani]AAO36759.1 23S rRNA methyltransferase [Clostridium tetani E88]AVP53954.1 RNA methyltransferase [Clostridium tetani]KGI39233.1 RNA methyltransferase [Clostridium tetani ATCC 9441]KGI41145.1 RNA methyltransferase [Clostridium tetani]KGI45168.1 RNA methyltransferase [Clostridium tetani]